MTIRLVLENTPSNEIAPMPQCPSNAFIEAALRTAKHSKSKTRNAILIDVCNVLGCKSEDLDFLFEYKSVLPCEGSVSGLELPDYRMSLSEIYKEAAE